jgi:hypothetical protein
MSTSSHVVSNNSRSNLRMIMAIANNISAWARLRRGSVVRSQLLFLWGQVTHLIPRQARFPLENAT